MGIVHKIRQIMQEIELVDIKLKKIIAGTNQSDATLIPLDSKVFAKIKKDTTGWFAFTTGDDGMNCSPLSGQVK